MFTLVTSRLTTEPLPLLVSLCFPSPRFPREELEGFVSSGTLTHLKLCFSRDAAAAAAAGGEEAAVPAVSQPPPACPRYVQHNLRLHSQRVSRLLLRHDARLYVCG